MYLVSYEIFSASMENYLHPIPWDSFDEIEDAERCVAEISDRPVNPDMLVTIRKDGEFGPVVRCYNAMHKEPSTDLTILCNRVLIENSSASYYERVQPDAWWQHNNSVSLTLNVAKELGGYTLKSTDLNRELFKKTFSLYENQVAKNVKSMYRQIMKSLPLSYHQLQNLAQACHKHSRQYPIASMDERFFSMMERFLSTEQKHYLDSLFGASVQAVVRSDMKNIRSLQHIIRRYIPDAPMMTAMYVSNHLHENYDEAF